MKKIMSFLVLVIGISASAQLKKASITGIVKANENPIEAATVLLLKEKDSAVIKTAVTDKTGKFEMDNVSAGRYLISITAVGYQIFRTNSFSIDSSNTLVNIPAISLSPAAKNLGGVTVVTQRPFIERKIDKLVINVASSPIHA